METLRPDLEKHRDGIFKQVDTKIQTLTLEAAPLGTVISSLFSPSDMIKRYGESILNTWVPADGRQLPDACGYTKVTGRPVVPDLRGMFLRGLNEFEQGKRRADKQQDPDGDARQVGSYQPDEVGKHNHTYVRPGGTDGNRSGRQDAFYLAQTGYTGDTGGNETRSKNVAVFYYVKIN